MINHINCWFVILLVRVQVVEVVARVLVQVLVQVLAQVLVLVPVPA